MAHQGRGPQKPQRFFQNESERRTEPSRQQPMKNQPPGRNDTPKKTPEKQPAEKPKPQNPLMSLLSLDKDMSVVLPLLLLLGREGADDMLTLALLYIMT